MRHSEAISTYDQAGNLIDTRVVEWDTTVEQDNEDALSARTDAALVDLRALANTTGTLTGAQLSTGLRLVARCVLGLARLHLRRFDATD